MNENTEVHTQEITTAIIIDKNEHINSCLLPIATEINSNDLTIATLIDNLNLSTGYSQQSGQTHNTSRNFQLVGGAMFYIGLCLTITSIVVAAVGGICPPIIFMLIGSTLAIIGAIIMVFCELKNLKNSDQGSNLASATV